MPKAAIKKYGNLDVREYKVCSTSQVFDWANRYAIPKAQSMDR